MSETVGALTRAWIRLAREDARNLGLTLPQLFVLRGLAEHGTVPVTHWADRMGTSPSAMTGILDGMESSGLISRSHASADRRQVLVSLTPKGAKLSERLSGDFRRRWKGYCVTISASDMGRASDVLARILARMAPSDDSVPRAAATSKIAGVAS